MSSTHTIPVNVFNLEGRETTLARNSPNTIKIGPFNHWTRGSRVRFTQSRVREKKKWRVKGKWRRLIIFFFSWSELIFFVDPSWSESNFLLLFFYSIRVSLNRSELIRPRLVVRVDPVRLLYLPRQHWFKSGSNLVQNLVQNWFKPDVWSTNQSQIVVHHVVWSIKVDVKRRKIQIVEVFTNHDKCGQNVVSL